MKAPVWYSADAYQGDQLRWLGGTTNRGGKPSQWGEELKRRFPDATYIRVVEDDSDVVRWQWATTRGAA